MKIKLSSVCVAAVFLLSAAVSACFAGIRVLALEGSARIWDAPSGIWRALNVGDTIAAGSSVETSAGSYLEGLTARNHRVKIFAETRVSVDESSEDSSVFTLALGALRSVVGRLRAREKYRVNTPDLIVGVRGTDFLVEVDKDRKTRVEVYDGVVAAREKATGLEFELYKGDNRIIEPSLFPYHLERRHFQTAEVRRDLRAEMNKEITKDAVVSRASQEIKYAEYQNGKVMTDVDGRRVRLEEYIVRPTARSFKYVVLNHRDERFDFAKIVWTFSAPLPSDLSLVTGNMYEYYGDRKPSLYLTDVDAVFSNGADRINETVSGGDMVRYSESSNRWYFAPGVYTFSVNGARRSEYQSGPDAWTYYDGTGVNPLPAPQTEFSFPSGNDAYHYRIVTTWDDGFWLAQNVYLIDDEGKVQNSYDFGSMTYAQFLRTYYQLNIQKEFTSSAFENAEARNKNGRISIDLVYSNKLLMDAGFGGVRALAPSY